MDFSQNLILTQKPKLIWEKISSVIPIYYASYCFTFIEEFTHYLLEVHIDRILFFYNLMIFCDELPHDMISYLYWINEILDLV